MSLGMQSKPNVKEPLYFKNIILISKKLKKYFLWN